MRNVYRDDRNEVLVKRMTEQTHPLLGKPLFPTIREFLCFAAALGYAEKERVPLGNKTHEVPGRVFENSDAALDLVYLLALSETKSPDVLRIENDHEAVTIFEEYANGGSKIIDRWLKETPSDANGDQAIIAALQKYGYLEAEQDTDEPIEIDI